MGSDNRPVPASPPEAVPILREGRKQQVLVPLQVHARGHLP